MCRAGDLGGAALVVGLLGLLFIAASLLSLMRVRRTQPHELRDALFLAGLAVTFALQFVFGLRLLMHSRNSGDSETIAILVIVCFLIGIARSWELVGGPSIGLRHELTALARARREEAGDSEDAS